MLGLAGLLGLGLGVGVTGVCAYTGYALTHPPRRTYASAVAKGRPGTPAEIPGAPREFQAWQFESRGRRLPVWDIRGDAHPADGPTVVLTHGWGDSRVGALARIASIAPFCSRLVAWDMPGHGESRGTCELGTHEPDDLIALLDRVREPGSRLILFGWSLGAGVSIAAAARGVQSRRARIDGVIAEAPYRHAWTPAANVMRARGLPHRWNIPPVFAMLGLELGVGPTWSWRGGFDRAALAAKLECPLLVLHGAEDDISPVEDGRQIAAAAKQGTFCPIAGAGHYGLWTEAPFAAQCVEAVRPMLGPAGQNTPAPRR